MRDIIGQFLAVWRNFKPLQKLTVVSVLLSLGVVLSYLVFCSSSSSHLVSLYSGEQLEGIDVSEVRNYLNSAKVPFQEKREGAFLVPEEYAHKLKLDLAAAGIPKQEHGKGFELFDTNTWIKGDKELQVLEMRALKGQLESDIAEYDNIKSASVILDLAPPRLFGGAQYKTKASVILTLKPGGHLSTSQLCAITFHLAGAVRGLEPNMIAISDTTGKLYQAIDPESTGEAHVNSGLVIEETLQAKVDGMLRKIVGFDHFYNTVQVKMGKEKEKVEAISVGILVDNSLLVDQTITAPEVLRKEIERQVKVLAQVYGVEVQAVTDFVPFERKKNSWMESKEEGGYTHWFLTGAAVLIMLGFVLRKFWRGRKAEEDSLAQLITRIDIDKLAEAIKEEDPENIALILSYLKPPSAEKILLALPEKVQRKVMVHLHEND